MKALSKILVLAASAAFVTPVSAQLVQHEKGRNFKVIAKCLEDIGLEDGVHFRDGGSGIIQLNGAAVHSDFLTKGVKKSDIDACWKSDGKKK